jgi:hypothetical protein
MLLSDVSLKPYTDTAYLKQSIARLVCILFPELEKLVPTLHMVSVYALLEEFPGAKQIAEVHLTRLKALLHDASRGRYGRDMAVEIREAARASIGSVMPAKSLELRHTIHLTRELDAEIEEIETAIQTIMEKIHSPITAIPGISCRMGAMILAESGDFSRFESPDKLLAYAGLSPSTYQSGQLKNCYATWRNGAPDICAMPSSTLPNMSAFGTQPLPPTSRRSEQRASTTMLPFPTRPRSWYASSTP